MKTLDKTKYKVHLFNVLTSNAQLINSHMKLLEVWDSPSVHPSNCNH